MQNCIKTLADRYYQLYLVPEKGKSDSEEYQRIVKSGGVPDCFSSSGDRPDFPPSFTGTSDDRLFTIQTPVGPIECIYLENRTDFERMIQLIAWKCEDKPVPETMGACTILGIINWRKIEAHKTQFLSSGGNFLEWPDEFASFTKDKKNFKDKLVIISKGFYSAVSSETLALDESLWLKQSERLRLYHEITHVICRELFPENIDALWDELLADCIGLCAATGEYDVRLAERLLGIDSSGLYIGGRMKNYFDEGEDMQQYVPQVHKYTDFLSNSVRSRAHKNMTDEELFDLVITVEKEFCSSKN